METKLAPGTYIVAVSGGVDSMALLHQLQQQSGLKLIVAHYDHGIREDSHLDRIHVQKYAQKHGLPFVYDEGHLGKGTSEEDARKARYEFLHKVREISGAAAIVTAHHQDDLLETAAHNIFRGTGRKGLSSLKNTKHVKRPLLQVRKEQLKKYANENAVTWREDSTNADVRYVRNYLRTHVLPKLDEEQRQKLIELITHARGLNRLIDHYLSNYLKNEDKESLDRTRFIKLPFSVACEVMAAWLRKNGIRHFDRKMIEQLVIASKTYAAGKAAHINKDHYLSVEGKNLALKDFER